MNQIRVNTFHGLTIGLLSFVLAGCSQNDQKPDAATTAKTASVKATKDPLVVTADSALLARLKMGVVTNLTLAETLRVPGRLEANLYQTARIGSPIAGRITKIDARFSQEVKAGQVLAEISSPDLAQAQLNFLKAHSQQQLTGRAVERAQLLLSADVIGTAELQRRQSELQIANAEKRAIADQLNALGIPASRIAQLERTGQIQSGALITASTAGTVIDLKVTAGQMVNPTDILFTVSNLNELWAVAELPEQDSQFVKKGQRVQIEVPALENQRIIGTVAYVSDLVNPETRTVRVGVTVQNTDRRLKPAMLMTMMIEANATPKSVVPSSSVVRENDVDYIFVKTATDSFRLVKIELGPESQAHRPLLKPLPNNAASLPIVVEGAFHLNNVRQQRGLTN
jgi:membrane fusion protein, heavy metal efflux system